MELCMPKGTAKVLVIEDDARLAGTIALRWRVLLSDGQWWESSILYNTKNEASLQRLLIDIHLQEALPAFRIDDRRAHKEQPR